jgi:two-component system, OmpR family, sensor kinase
VREDDRLFSALERLLASNALELESAMQQGADTVADVLGADKVDVFVLAADGQDLVAIGASNTAMGRHERALGLDRLPIAGCGHVVEVFKTGHSYLSRHADQDPDEVRAIVELLGVSSSAAAPVIVAGKTRGVLLAASATSGFFSERDQRFLEAVAHWIGLVAVRALHVEQLAERAAEQSLRLAAEEVTAILTPRQQEVAALIVEGLTNAEIAQRLVLTPGTVANHVAQIMDRLGVRSRTRVAAVWVTGRGLPI